MVLNCNCEHAYQDKLYGKYRRAHNKTTKGIGVGEVVWRCTVCLKEKTKTSSSQFTQWSK